MGATPVAAPASTLRWTPAAAMGVSRYGARSARLANGNVLAAGGVYNAPTSSAELYDPASGTWSPTSAMT